MKKGELAHLGGEGRDRVVFVSQDGRITLNVRIEGESVWLTQTAMAELFGCTPENIVQHLKNVYAEGELQETATTKNFLVVRTAAKLVVHRADPTLPFMGMKSYDKKNPRRITKQDAVTAKNYLTEDEMKDLGLLVEQFLAFAEAQARRHVAMKMDDWIAKLDGMLQFNGRDLLKGAGSIAHAVAEETAALRLEEYRDNLRAEEHRASLEELERDLKELEENEDGER